ncbi:MAG: PKD domain-containing protein [Bacteroidota bacterium]
MKKLIIIPLSFIAASLFIFTGCKEEEPPAAGSLSVTEITSDSAKSEGDIIDNGGAPVTSRGVVWSKSENPTVDEKEGMTDDGKGTGEFTSELTDLTPNTTYYVRAYATNKNGTAYSEQKKFTTESAAAIVITAEVSNITPTTATSGGYIIDDGGAPVTSRGLVWSKSENPTVDEKEGMTDEGEVTGIFTSKLTNLTSDTTYYFRTYATNSAGTAYGNQIEFNTKASLNATFSADKEKIQPGTTIHFTDDSDGNPDSWSWNFGDGNTSSEENPSHSYSSEGSYTVELTVSNDCDEDTETKTDYIEVGNAPTADFRAEKRKIQPGTTVQFTDGSDGNPDSWSWDFGDGNSSSKENPFHTYFSEGSYTVELAVSNEYGEDTEKRTDYIKVGSAPTANFSADQTKIQPGTTIHFTDDSNGNPDSWNWDFGDGTTSNEENPSHNYSREGIYTVELTVSNEYGEDTKIKGDCILVESEDRN